jgi:hypothetical protein
MIGYHEIREKGWGVRFPNRPLHIVVLILLIVLALVAIALLPTILVLLG